MFIHVFVQIYEVFEAFDFLLLMFESLKASAALSFQ